jgi:hypothetical protein
MRAALGGDPPSASAEALALHAAVAPASASAAHVTAQRRGSDVRTVRERRRFPLKSMTMICARNCSKSHRFWRFSGFVFVFPSEPKFKILHQSTIIQISLGFWQIHRDTLPGWKPHSPRCAAPSTPHRAPLPAPPHPPHFPSVGIASEALQTVPHPTPHDSTDTPPASESKPSSDRVMVVINADSTLDESEKAQYFCTTSFLSDMCSYIRRLSRKDGLSH